MDMAALLWIQKIDPHLYNRVKIDNSLQIKNGHRLSQLVPTIAKAFPGMIKSLVGINRREVINLISEINLGSYEEENHNDTIT